MILYQPRNHRSLINLWKNKTKQNKQKKQQQINEFLSIEIFSHPVSNYVLQASKLLAALLLVTVANVSII